MKLTKLLSGLAVAGLAIATGSAHASLTFSFNPLGNGAGAGVIGGAGLLDQAPGSTLALKAVAGGGPLAVGTVITDYYQANLAAVETSASGVLYANGDLSQYFTFVASFTETVTGSGVLGGNVINTFSISGGTFKMCAQSALGDALNGTGFSCAGSGILSGSISAGNATQTGNPAALVNLDGAGSDNWGGTQTVTSNGSAALTASINFVDANYFPDLALNTQMVLAAINTTLITPFSQVDPSKFYSSDTVANGDVAANVGAINGITGPNFIFQSDANSSFTATPIPEPGSLALAGVALAGLSLIARRRKK